MRRVRNFVLRLEASGCSRQLHYDSWHAICDSVPSELADPQSYALVFDARGLRRPIAIVAAFNLQSTPESLPQYVEGIDWRSEMLVATVASQRWFLNCNVSDFQWELLEGAKRDVPFRLSFAERRAQRAPNGIWAFSLGMLEQWRDRLLTRA